MSSALGCPRCGQSLPAAATNAATTVRCSACGATVPLSGKAPTSAPLLITVAAAAVLLLLPLIAGGLLLAFWQGPNAGPGGPSWPPLIPSAPAAFVAEKAELMITAHQADVLGVTFVSERHLITVAADGLVLHFDLSNGEETTRIPGKPGTAWARVALGGGGLTLAALDAQGNVTLSNARSGAKGPNLTLPSPVRRLALSSDGDVLATVHDGGEVLKWDTASGHRLDAQALPADVRAVAFGVSAVTLADCGDSTVRFLGPNGLAPGKVLPDPGLPAAPRSGDDPAGPRLLTAHLWGKHFASADGGRVVVLRETAGKVLAVLRHPDDVTAVAFGPDLQFAASGTRSGTVYVWQPQDGQVVGFIEAPADHPSPVRSLAFSSDATVLALARGHEVVVRGLKTLTAPLADKPLVVDKSPEG